MNDNYKVVVVDSSPLFFLGLRIILKDSHRNIVLTNFFKTKNDLYKYANDHSVEMVIVNFTHADNPFKTIKDIINIKTAIPTVKVFVYTGEKNSILIKLLFDIGVNAIVSRNESASQLADFVHDAMQGEFVYSHLYIVSLIRDNLKMLTDRELDVLIELHNGLSLTLISKMFHKSIKTISNNKRSAMKKLEVSGTLELEFI